MATDDTAPREAGDDEAGTRGPLLKYRGKNNATGALGGGQPFLLYWCKEDKDWFYPVGLWEYTDFSPKNTVSKSEILQFKFDTDKNVLDVSALLGTPLLCRLGSESWSRPVQRKGQNFYIARGTGSMPMRSVQNAVIYGDQLRFALRMDIVSRDDAWISNTETTGSIRMRDRQQDRAWLVAVRHGDDWTDPFGSQTTFAKRSWADLIG
ncbi:hypothetical protein AB0H34_37255 [Saccharopolyspora shandongensis]|uniref:hypothetical protein n=1 Tax=Saccharopolyspora shandongensis TaxID=418495 RepID=UPI0033FAC2A1